MLRFVRQSKVGAARPAVMPMAAICPLCRRSLTRLVNKGQSIPARSAPVVGVCNDFKHSWAATAAA